ncbi:unnamed protein product [Thlaspi arvense]|uniref:Fatty acyl-CoA reductase C-terminal domain-containing protein n=1 Tax=Thlaspi arvense TaxID=13288 RepID=A0AAU9SPT0_THLAR|nr:unnamed protein product [Thlaspi arvense]
MMKTFPQIPVDMVANVMLAAAEEHTGDTNTHTVYHVGSSRRNPMTLKQFRDVVIRYFLESPLIGHKSMPIVASNVKILSSMTLVTLYMFLRHKLPLQILRLASMICPWRYGDEYIHKSRKVKTIMRLVELYKHYALVKLVFDDKNVEKLRIKRKNVTKEMGVSLGIDPKCIDWEDYFMATHIPGLITHVLEEQTTNKKYY